MHKTAHTSRLLAALLLALPVGLVTANDSVPPASPEPALVQAQAAPVEVQPAKVEAQPAAAEIRLVQAQPADTWTPRLNELTGQVGAAMQRIDAMQTEMRNLSQSVNHQGEAISALSDRVGKTESAMVSVQAMAQQRLEEGAHAVQVNTERLNLLQSSLTLTQRDLGTLHGQLAQAESALIKHGAWLAKQKVDTDTVSSTASEALQRAIAAGKLAEGKLLYEAVLSEELTQFPAYKADLSDSAKEALMAFAEKLKAENENVYLEIQGHTDTSGSQRLNQKLSKLRAESVRDFLNKECGLPVHRMGSVAYGDSKPVADNSTKQGRSQNRRVTVVVLK